MLPEFLRFHNKHYQQLHKLAGEEINYCVQQANEMLAVCNNKTLGNESFKIILSLLDLNPDISKNITSNVEFKNFIKSQLSDNFNKMERSAIAELR